MDAYASIISNNLNIVMKVLTSLTVMLAVPTLFASLWGMNTGVPFQGNLLRFLDRIGQSAAGDDRHVFHSAAAQDVLKSVFARPPNGHADTLF